MTGPTQDTRQIVYARAGYRCELCKESAVGGSVHHRRPRGMGGDRRPETNAPSNLLLLCGSATTGCHGWVEENRQHAMFLGLLVSRYDARPIPEIPVTLDSDRSIYLTDDGTYTDEAPTPREDTTP